ncbi:MAG: bifunctional DNA-formamidopyrimidine glycosylase/DNA-(apurinic or apyrimidinic site) lyase [Solirubrobacterales bacterium]|nr:bifunctional DNA-formamidopyrimidine glycosylase/DNA-(apurinic or apyrimidinic site) lyase [Solirubrobacterales bacterium]
MPELPEVETIRRQLAPLVEGRRLERIEILDERWSRPLTPQELADALTGRVIERLGRRGKYLLWSFDGDVHLAQHLRMTGSVLLDPRPEPRHTRVRLQLRPRGDAGGSPGHDGGAEDVGLRMVIVDPRRFGTAELLLGDEALEKFFGARLGLEPFDELFTVEHLRALTRGRTAPIKALLLDQRKIAGVGNIYADEALFRAGIHPLRAAGALSTRQLARLREGLIEALSAGIDARGATIDDFRHVDGVRGSFQDQFLVHRRAGEPCGLCGGTVVKMVVAGRGTYVCEKCQPRPRRAGRRRSQAASSSSSRPLSAAASTSA